MRSDDDDDDDDDRPHPEAVSCRCCTAADTFVTAAAVAI